MALNGERESAGERHESRHASAALIGVEQRLWESLATDAFRSSPAPIPQVDRETLLTEKKKAWSRILCSNATDRTSLLLAEKLVKQWFGSGCDCEQVKLDKWSE